MSKTHRGTGVRKEPNHGRGICPICGKTQVKLLYEKEVDGKKVKVCKVCSAHLKNEAKKAEKAAKKAAAAAAPAADAAPAAAE